MNVDLHLPNFLDVDILRPNMNAKLAHIHHHTHHHMSPKDREINARVPGRNE